MFHDTEQIVQKRARVAGLLFFVNRVFNIKLAPPQLGALMAVFDKDNDGTVDCAEFLLRFFLIGFQVRGRGRRGYEGATNRGTREA